MKNNPKKQFLIETAYSLLEEKGYHGTGVNDLIAVADIPKGSFYHYFPSKDELVISVLGYYTSKIEELLKSFLQEKTFSPSKRIIALYSFHVNSYIKKLEFPYGNFASRIAQEAGEKSAGIKNAANNVFFTIREAHYQCILEGQKTGELLPHLDGRKLAEMIIYAWEGAVLRMKGSRSIESLFIFEEMLRTLIFSE